MGVRRQGDSAVRRPGRAPRRWQPAQHLLLAAHRAAPRQRADRGARTAASRSAFHQGGAGASPASEDEPGRSRRDFIRLVQCSAVDFRAARRVRRAEACFA